MEFFNRKEEVLEIQLTQEGKRLLAKGEFKPFYYEFFDDDILYETEGAGFAEEQNSAVPRIKETPRLKTQNIIYGLETEFKKQTDSIVKLYGITGSKEIEQFQKKTPYNKNHDPLKYALGLGDYSRNLAPAWDVLLETGFINTSSVSTTYNSEPDYYEYIPQINCSSSYLYKFRNDLENYGTLQDSKTYKIIYTSEIFKDKTYYVIYEKDNIKATIKEINSTFDKENFDIEIFEVETVDGQKENLKSLYFTSQDIDPETSVEQLKLQPYDVEWFFSIINDEALTAIETEEEFDPYIDIEAANSQESC